MKKTLLLSYLLGLSLFIFNVKAQKTRLGIVAGTNYSMDNHVLESTRLGISGGVFLDVIFKSNIFLRGEITYLVKQRADLAPNQMDDKPTPYTVGAWQIPINVGYRFKTGNWQPYVQGGAYVHSAQNTRGNNQVGLSLEGRRQEYIRFNTGAGVQWKKVALELEWQIGQKVSKSDFMSWNNPNVNAFAIGGPGGCMPSTDGREYPINGGERPRPNEIGSVRNDAFLLKLRYFFN